MDTTKPRIVVLAGGISNERAVSLRSGAAVLKGLQTAGYETRLEDLSTVDLKLHHYQNCDLVFPVLHGSGGEDGSIQAQLEAAHIPYVGAATAASALCFDKANYRTFLGSHHIPVAGGETVSHGTFMTSIYRNRPFVLKPINGGSSLDIVFGLNPYAVDQHAIERLFEKHHTMLLEEHIEGIEITVGVLDKTALPVVEILTPEGQVFDYTHKYDGSTIERCPPMNVSLDMQQTAQRLAETIHKITGCRHYSRTDMIVRADDTIVVLETNTLPGMTDQSLFPKAAQAYGLSMSQLTDRLVTNALRQETGSI